MALINRYNNFFDDMFNSPFFSAASNSYDGIMKTDVREDDKHYFVEIELPGFAKENLKVELNEGYLNVQAKKESHGAKEGAKYIRKECFEGTAKRSFYVGEYLHQDDIKASFKDGILCLEIPKEVQKIETAPKLISID